MPSIDLNCDLGESFGAYTIGMDAEILPYITSANIACGFHAGDPSVMQRSVLLCKEYGVQVGAHPGLPDLQGFGRRDMALSPDEAYSFVLYQISALAGFCKAEGAALAHVKPHGQLYNRAAKDAALAEAIAAAVHDFDPTLVLVGLAGGKLIEAGRAAGLATAQEFFADRNYMADGTLVPRKQENAVIADEDFAVARVVRAVQEGTIEAVDGSTIEVAADTICIHGDNAHALEFAKKIREALMQAGVELKPCRAQ